MLLYYKDLIIDGEFRKDVEKRLQQNSLNKNYSFTYNFPSLFRYRRFNSYTVDEILDNNITLSSIMEFNDSLEGNLRLYKSIEEINGKIDKEWRRHCELVESGCPDMYTYDMLRKIELQFMNSNQDNKSSMLIQDGTYIGCFTENANSILMWSHYADSSKGINIEYNFANIHDESILKHMLFPVCYSKDPIYVGDLMKDGNERKISKYPIDVAVLCGSLNKKMEWTYEKEWRIVYLMTISDIANTIKRIPIKKLIGQDLKPNSITFGYHFLKNFFYYKNEIDAKNYANKQLESCIKLLNYVKDNSIKCYYILPNLHAREMIRIEIKKGELLKYIGYYFENNESKVMDDYNSLFTVWLKKIHQYHELI